MRLYGAAGVVAGVANGVGPPVAAVEARRAIEGCACQHWRVRGGCAQAAREWRRHRWNVLLMHENPCERTQLQSVSARIQGGSWGYEGARDRMRRR